MTFLHGIKSKKIPLFFLTLTLALTIPFSSVSAGAGEWDYKGYSYTSTLYGYATGWPYYGYAVYNSGYVNSGGGDFKVYASKSGYYTLTEYDPTNADDIVSTKWINAGGYAVWNDLNGYRDGDNNTAEFFVYSNVKDAKVTFYD